MIFKLLINNDLNIYYRLNALNKRLNAFFLA